MLSGTSLRLVDLRARKLSLKHGVPVSAGSRGIGAVSGGYLSQVEYLLHEVAHWLTLGNTTKDIPSRLTSRIGNQLDGMTSVSADSVEIDTALVTFLAGYLLSMWDDPLDFAKSCKGNLQGIEALAPDPSYVLRAFDQRKSARSIKRMSEELAIWFRPSARGKLRVFSGRFHVEDPKLGSLPKVEKV